MSRYRSQVIGRAIAAAGTIALLTLPLAGVGHAEPTSDAASPTTTAAPAGETPATSDIPLPTTAVSTSATSSAPPAEETTGTLNIAVLDTTSGSPITGARVNVSDGTHVYPTDAPATISVVPGDYYVSVLTLPPGYGVVHEPGPIHITAGGGADAQVILSKLPDRSNGRATLVVRTRTLSGVPVPNVPVLARRMQPCNPEQHDIPPGGTEFERFTGVTDSSGVLTLDVSTGCYQLSMTPPAEPKPVAEGMHSAFPTEPGSTAEVEFRFQDPDTPTTAPQPRDPAARVPVSSIPSGPVSRR